MLLSRLIGLRSDLEAVYELIWLLPPLLIVCELPPRARPRPMVSAC